MRQDAIARGKRMASANAKDLASTSLKANTLVRTAGLEKYRRVPPICPTVGTDHMVTRMPYEMRPNRVGEMISVAPQWDADDTFATKEKLWYRQMGQLANVLWQDRPDEAELPRKKLRKVSLPENKNETYLTRPQGPMRRNRHVEIDRSEVRSVPQADDKARMQHVRRAVDKLGVKTDHCARDYATLD